MFSNVLKSLRKKAGYSQVELASLLNLSKSTIAMYEVGERMPDYDMMKRISRLFNVSMDYLYEKEAPAEPELTEAEAALLVLFRQIPPERQQIYLQLLRGDSNQQ